jgi:AcrR family transcriptional regulator
VSTEPGLRERKKQRTRRLIADTAHRLFAERGFDAVTVADVAREADVSEGTVFNYFATKEQLFWGEMESFEAALVEAVRTRPAGESLAAAFRRFIVERSERLAVDEVAALITTAARIVGDSPTLQAREREIVARATQALAEAIAAETGPRGGGLEPPVAASALMGVQRALVAQVHKAVLAGIRGRRLATEARAHGERAFALLERGLADYAVRER